MEENKLYEAAEWRKAMRDFKVRNPSPGDYWHDRFCPVLVVLHVEPGFLVVCTKTKEVDSRHWEWDLTQTEMIKPHEFPGRVKYTDVSMKNHFEVVAAFRKPQPEPREV